MGERRRRSGPIEVLPALDAALARRRAGADETGAALILALIFLIVAALTLTALVSFAGTGLLNAAGFSSQRGLQYGAEGAVEIAVQHVRSEAGTYKTLANCLGPTATMSVQLTEFQLTARYRVYCQGVTYPTAPVSSSTATVSLKTVTTHVLFTIDYTSFVGYGFSIANSGTVTSVVGETTSANTITLQTAAVTSGIKTIELFAPYQRLVTFYACRATGTTTCESQVEQPYASGNPHGDLVKAVVGFGDLTSTGKDECNATVTTSCGTSYVVTQWTVASANH